MKFFNLSDIYRQVHSRIREHLLWEFDYDNFNYDSGRKIVVERVVQRGNMADWLTILNLYGYDGVREEIKKLPYLTAKDMNFVQFIFDIPLNELKCYMKKQSATGHWNS